MLRINQTQYFKNHDNLEAICHYIQEGFLHKTGEVKFNLVSMEIKFTNVNICERISKMDMKTQVKPIVKNETEVRFNLLITKIGFSEQF